MPVATIGLVGLGRMGYALAMNMKDHGYDVIAYNRSPEKTKKAEQEGITGVYSLEELAGKLSPPRTLWLMVPAGNPVDRMISGLLPHLDQGDIIIDGGNSHYRDTLHRCQQLGEKGVRLVDAGISGGPEGARRGACAMVGADREAFQFLEPLLADICVPGGYLHTGRVGSGHFAKMVHNGIEYGMLQALGEGFEVLAASEFRFHLPSVAGLWQNGSVIRGWLLELLKEALEENPRLEGIGDLIEASGEGLWTVQTALEMGIPLPAITDSLFARYRSQQQESFSGKVVAALRNRFGGHALPDPEGVVN